MAFATRETIIANPGRKRQMAKPKKRRRLSAAQIKAGFGGKRRQNAAKHKRKSSASHKPRTKPHHAKPVARKNSPRKSSKRKNSKPARKRNLGGIFALTNPAKGHKHMAATKKNKKRKSSMKSNAGHHHSKKRNPGRRSGRRHNPGQYGTPTEWIIGGLGAVVGGVGAPALTQLAMGTSNTGPMGYFGNAVAVAVLAAASHFGLPRQKFLTMGIIFGGVGSIFRRIIGDYSLLGSYSSQVSGVSGMGDYLMNFNWPIPQQLAPGNSRALTPYGGTPAAMPVVNNSAQAAGMGASLYGPRLY
jgi:hypothetical protein